MSKIITILIFGAVIITGCGRGPNAALTPQAASSSSVDPTPTPTPTPTPSPTQEATASPTAGPTPSPTQEATTAPPESGVQEGRVGSTFTIATPVTGALNVQVADVIEPVASVSRGPSVADYPLWEDRGGSLAGSAPAPGKHFVAVKFVFANVSNTVVDSNRVGIYLFDTKGVFYNPNIDVIPGCASYVQHGFELKPTEAVTECALFQIPDSATVDRVRFGETVDSSGQVKTFAEWTTS